MPDLTPRAPVTAAFIAMLRDGLGDDIPVGDHAPPTVDEESEVAVDPPFVIVYAIPGGGRSGPPFSDEVHADTDWTYQATSVGVNPAHAQATADRVCTVVLGRANGDWVNELDADGQACMWREFDSTSGVQASGRVSTVADRYSLYLTPS